MVNGRTTQSSPSKCWLYTKFNWTTTQIIEDSECQYRIQGKEICPTTGTPHLQSYVHFNEEIRFTALQRKYPGINWKKAKGTGWENFVYCSKDGDFEELGTRPKQPKKNKTTADEPYLEAFKANSIEEGLGIIRQKRARDYCLHGEAIERNLKRARKPDYVQRYSADKFIIPLQELAKTTLICGPSNLGKTHYACAHFKRPLICSHIDNLKQLTPDHDGIIFDDMSFKHYPPESVIHLLDTEFPRTINVRYGTTSIPANTKKIFTHNSDNPFYDCDKIEETQRDAIERRVTRVNILNKIY